jgi:hypothetical protein
LNDLVRADQQGLRDREAEGFCGLQVDHQLELGGLLNREISGLRTFEDLVDEDRSPLEIRGVVSERARLADSWVIPG